MVADSDYRIKLQVFEGPLDLLLFLIRKNELDIYDIPIESVTRQYLDAIYAMEELELEVAGDFFVMAATLMEIKSRMLLPKEQRAVDPNADEDDAMDPRWELVHQLVQYRKFKDAASQLNGLIARRQDLIDRLGPVRPDASERPLQPVDRLDLWNAFNSVLRRLAEKLVVGEISDDHVTVVDQMEFILKRVQEQKSFLFSELFPEKITLRTLIATFLAVLELVRLRRLSVRQEEAFSDIACSAAEQNELENQEVVDDV